MQNSLVLINILVWSAPGNNQRSVSMDRCKPNFTSKYWHWECYTCTYWQRCISDGQCGFNEFIESYYMVQYVLPIVYPILFTGSMNSLNPYHMRQCVHSVAHIIWYTVTSLCVWPPWPENWQGLVPMLQSGVHWSWRHAALQDSWLGEFWGGIQMEECTEQVWVRDGVQTRQLFVLGDIQVELRKGTQWTQETKFNSKIRTKVLIATYLYIGKYKMDHICNNGMCRQEHV